MRSGRLETFLHCFTLKQGTVLIAIVQLLVSGIVTTFCLLALAHAMDVQEMVARDSEDALEREAFEDVNSMHLNTKKMERAHHYATEKVYVIYSVLVLVVIHLVSIILLLYGVLTSNRKFMVPWLMVNLTDIAAMIFCLLIFLGFQQSGIVEKIIVVWMAHINVYCYFVVYSTYRYLETKKGLTHEVHGAKKKYTHPPAGSSKSLSRSASQTYEV